MDAWSDASAGYRRQRRIIMAWNTPKVTEIPLGAEINSYVCGEKK